MTTSAITSSLSQTSTTASTRSQISSDFDTFLKMLTAQMQNQDPFNPIDSTDYATQLATFSGVEQQTRTNDLLTNLGSQIASLLSRSDGVPFEGRMSIASALAGMVERRAARGAAPLQRLAGGIWRADPASLRRVIRVVLPSLRWLEIGGGE